MEEVYGEGIKWLSSTRQPMVQIQIIPLVWGCIQFSESRCLQPIVPMVFTEIKPMKQESEEALRSCNIHSWSKSQCRLLVGHTPWPRKRLSFSTNKMFNSTPSTNASHVFQCISKREGPLDRAALTPLWAEMFWCLAELTAGNADARYRQWWLPHGTTPQRKTQEF